MDQELILLQSIIFILLYRCFCKPFNGKSDSETEWLINRYLHEKLNDVHNELNDKDQNFENESKEIEMVYNTAWDTAINDTKSAKIFTFFGSTYFLLGNQVLRGIIQNNSFQVEKYSTWTNSDSISLLKSVEFQNLGFLLTRTENSTTIHKHSNESVIFKNVQNLPTPDVVDAQFFVNNDNLYLVVIYSEGEYLSIYKWLGTYFDEIDTYSIKSGTKMSLFFEKHPYIIITKVDHNKEEYALTVYKFKREALRKIQEFEIKNPSHIETYLLGSVPHVIIFTEEKNNLIYKWGALGLDYMHNFYTDIIVNNSVTIDDQVAPLIITPSNKGVTVNKPNSNGKTVLSTKEYLTNYSVIWDINKGGNENGHIIFIVGLNEDNIVNINTMSFKVHPEIDNETESDVLKKCFYKLEENIYTEKRKLNATKQSLSENKNNQTVPSLVKRQDPDSNTDTLENEADLSESLNSMKERLFKLTPLINSKKENKMVLNRNVTFEGPINVRKLNTTNLHVKKINGDFWAPEQLLRYNESQTITGHVVFENVSTNILAIPPTVDDFFKDMMLKNGNQVISGQVSVENFTALNISTPSINNIKIDDVYLTTSPTPVKSVKTFENIKTNEAQVTEINKQKPDKILALFTDAMSSNVLFDSDVNITNLWVKTIDNINWNNFKNSAYQLGQSTPIQGKLSFSKLITDKLYTDTLNNINVEDFLTTNTNQNISSFIRFKEIHAGNIVTETINNVSLENSAVLVNEDAVITGPIKIHNLNVENDVTFVGDIDESLFLKFKSNNEMYGTNESHLLQKYTNKVLIKGDLYLNNVSLAPQSNLIISDERFDLDQYWTKTSSQNIPVHFEALNGISVSHLNTTQINGFNMTQYMRTNEEPTESTAYHFENVTVFGNVILDETEIHTPDLNEISKYSVKTNGMFEISGKKIFNGTLKIHNLSCDILNGLNVSEAVTINSPVVNGTKSFQNIIIKENVLTSYFSVKNINKVNIDTLRESVIYNNRDQEITKLDFKNVSVANLTVSTINGMDFNKFIETKENLYSGKDIAKLIVQGNITLKNVQNVEDINGVAMKPLLDRISEKSSAKGLRIKHDLTFLGNVKVNNLITKNVNGINLPQLFKRLLYKTSNQTVFAPYTFSNLKTKNLFTNQINDVNTTHLVDITSEEPQEIYAPFGVTLQSAQFMESINADIMLPCDFKEIKSSLENPQTQLWHTVEVQGNTTILDEENAVYRIVEKTVQNKTQNIISSRVEFKNNLTVENVSSRRINQVGIEKIIDDAVFIDSGDEQVITGHKTFREIEAADVESLENMDAPIVNSVFIEELYQRIISQDQISNNSNIFITGRKTFFAGLQTNNFYSKTVSNILPENIVSVSNLSKIPSAVIDYLDIENDLNVKKVNNFDFEEILGNRLLVNGSEIQITNATYFFEDLDVIDNLETISINEISIDDVVFDVGTQNITSKKKFDKNIDIQGNTQIDYINNVNINTFYQEAILNGKNNFINSSMRFLRPAQLDGNITTRTINGYPFDSITQMLEKETRKAEENTIFAIKQHIESIVNQSVPYISRIPNEYMYIEKSEALQISVPNSINAKVVQSRNYVLIQILSEESAEVCGLPEKCHCPSQYTVEISTKDNSMVPYIEKGQQRIFSYDDDNNMIVFFNTNSISNSEKCRTDRSKIFTEPSSINWTLYKPTNSSLNLHPKFVDGYISGVEFFTLNGFTYVIIGRFYDPIANTHDLDCTIMKFNTDKTQLEIIQTIPTKGVEKLYLFHTAQGVTLVIGNKDSSYENSNTEIYRFNQDIEKMELLRKVPYICSDVVGVVLGYESLIVLAYKQEPIEILKYNPYFDNYYYYQNFPVEAPVVGISAFYTGGFGISDAYLCVVTENEYFYIYTFQFIDGWKLEAEGSIDGIRNLIPFELNKELYLFTPSSKLSSLLTIVKHGSP